MKYLILSLALIFPGCLTAEDAPETITSRMEARELTRYDAGENLLYRQYSPKNPEEGKTYPLLVFLHGYGERGSDNEKQLKHCAADILDFVERENQPCYVIFPQCPDTMRWVRYIRPLTDPPHRMDRYPTLPLQLVEALIEKTIRELPIDGNRVYVAGLSMGGFATWELISRRPELFAAAIPVCGGGDPTQVEQFRHLPIRVFHGGADTTVVPAFSTLMVEALKKAGAKDVEYTEYEGVGHDSWTATFRNPEVLRWLFRQKR